MKFKLKILTHFKFSLPFSQGLLFSSSFLSSALSSLGSLPFLELKVF